MKTIRLFIGHSFVNAKGIKLQWTKTQVKQVVKQLVKNYEAIKGFTLTQGNLGAWERSYKMSSCLEFIVENDNDALIVAIALLRDDIKDALMQQSVMCVTQDCAVSF